MLPAPLGAAPDGGPKIRGEQVRPLKVTVEGTPTPYAFGASAAAVAVAGGVSVGAVMEEEVGACSSEGPFLPMKEKDTASFPGGDEKRSMVPWRGRQWLDVSVAYH